MPARATVFRWLTRARRAERTNQARPKTTRGSGTTFVTEVIKDKIGDLVNKVVRVVPNVNQTLGFSKESSTGSACPAPPWFWAPVQWMCRTRHRMKWPKDGSSHSVVAHRVTELGVATRRRPTSRANKPFAMRQLTVANRRDGSFATDPFSISSGQCPLL
jgi:hypothetical protein